MSDNRGRGEPRGRLPALGPHGEGWVVLQFVLIAGLALSALAGRGWPEALRVPAVVVGVTVMVLGVALVLAGAAHLGSTAWTPLPRPRSGSRLAEHGVHARARHPMYGGAILVAAGWSVIFASLAGAILTVLLVLFFELKSRREETLLAEHATDYAEYRARTPRRFLPWLY
jgi:protein-S-isoprenylcysteine O-methyltransferase Ste14